MPISNDKLAQKIENTLEIPMIFLAILVLPIVTIELGIIETNPDLMATAQLIDDIIWFIFLAEYLILITLHTNKSTYTRNNWFMVLILILTPPIIVPESFAALRSLRALRTLRVARGFRVLIAFHRGLKPISDIFQKNSLHYVTSVSVFLIVTAGVVFSHLEQMKPYEGIWWALTTVTTVGYGDLYPESVEGRILAFFVMLIGIGFVSVLTANIAAYFVESDNENEKYATESDIKALLLKMDVLSEKIEEIDNKLSEK
ncbi:voltage-gated potassium channel [Methanohalophilus levihalophilus]|uniref:potassium channel family protein n=1 Tax=Methanohalophilus levihalophilus TaxID=1431282 RepID=UPI001AE77A70|nr:potassium channel family protein [Methanohalophilus levihalophilus]MBP2030014.1 voltage-gated potassium channel [Methanohalophilus levihalophilus]